MSAPAALSSAACTSPGVRIGSSTMGGADGSFGYTSTNGTPARLNLRNSAAIRGSLSVKSPIIATALIFFSFARVLGISMLVRLFQRQFKQVLAVKSTSTG